MTDELGVLLEIGPKRKRAVASAMDWPGLERWGRNEDEDQIVRHVYASERHNFWRKVGIREPDEGG